MRSEPTDVARFLDEWADDARIDVVQGTPSLWQFLLRNGWAPRPGLRVWCGGEAMTRSTADALLAAGVDLWNLYGPSETTVWATAHHVRVDSPGDDVVISIGTSIDGATVRVVDSEGAVVEAGAVGEIAIGGVGVGLGYMGDPGRTAQQFVGDPFAAPGATRYRTGDLGRVRDDGALEFLGRSDHQVKVRGHRIELGEIEEALLTHPHVIQAAVLAEDDAAGSARLVAHVVPGDGFADLDAVRAHLATSLPAVMVPSRFAIHAELPLLPSGKLDRLRLAASDADADAGPAAPEDVGAIWREVLGVASCGPEDDFFELGGHSLLAAELVWRLAEEIGVVISLDGVFGDPTLAGILRLVAEARS